MSLHPQNSFLIPAETERVENFDLPKTEKARNELASVMAADGQRLLTALDALIEQSWRRELPAVKTLRRVWEE